MKEFEEKDSDDLKNKEIMTRRQAIKRIGMSAGLGIAAIVFGALGADASKNCCIDAYPDYGYGNYYSNYYHNSYSNYSNSYSNTFYHNYYNYSNYYNSGSYDNTYKDYGYRTNQR
ncbi:MAG TPA: hypothetical protein VEI57_07975 [Nitrospirota bacterium]|nr:hypothetical protein [Nitrospirota bacterium]